MVSRHYVVYIQLIYSPLYIVEFRGLATIGIYFNLENTFLSMLIIKVLGCDIILSCYAYMHVSKKSSQRHCLEAHPVLSCPCSLPYVPGEVRMDPKTEISLYPCGGAACAPMAMGGIPPESQLSRFSGRYLMSF
jgi:hypothetical protein